MALVMAWVSHCVYRWSGQLGWIPPTPTYLFKMARAKRRAKRS
jgi:hypothetical protein